MRKADSLVRCAAGLSLLLLLTGCITRPANPTTYYTLDYLADSEQGSLFVAEPYDVSVQVPDTTIGQAYARPQIVERGLGPRFTYLSRSLWGIDLSETIADLVARRISAYGFSGQIQRQISRQAADLQLRSDISAIEYVRYENIEQAVLSITFSVWDSAGEEELFSRRSEVVRTIFGNDVGVFVSEVNRALFEQLDTFLTLLADYLETGDIPQTGSSTAEQTDSESAETDTEAGVGVLLVPEISDASNQPFFTLFAPDGSEIGGYQFGEAVRVPRGVYTVQLGNGPDELQTTVTGIQVRSRQQTVVQPTWSAMTVEIVDSNREPARVRYDIYSSTTGRSYGGRISTTEQFSSAQTTWVLPAGEYKVIINNRPFTTLRDFVTVNLPAGEVEQLTIVVGTDENGNLTSMLGAGDITTGSEMEDDSPLTLASAINASFSFTADNEEAEEVFDLVNIFDSEIDTDLSYEVGPLRYELSNTVAVAFNAVNEAPLRVASDRFRLRNTLLYSITDIYGFYARADASAPLTGNVTTREDAFNYLKRDGTETVEQQTGVNQVRLSPPFFPLALREGAGINVNAVQSEQLDLGIRGGIGASQDVRWEVYSAAGTEEIDSTTYSVFERQMTEAGIGLELLGFMTALLPLNTSLSTTAEVFVPFDEQRTISVEIENVVNVVLVNNVSLYYRYLVRNAENADGEPYLIHDHGIFIRLNYLLRL